MRGLGFWDLGFRGLGFKGLLRFMRVLRPVRVLFTGFRKGSNPIRALWGFYSNLRPVLKKRRISGSGAVFRGSKGEL